MRVSLHELVLVLLLCGAGRVFGLIEDLYPSSSLDQIKLLYCDADIIVLDKPPNLNTVPGVVESTSLAQYAAEVFKVARVDQMIVHRLDYGTSGVVVLARNIEALTILHKQFRNKHQVFKEYSAVVFGTPPSMEGEIDLPLGKDSLRGSPFQAFDPVEGKPSLTLYRLRQYSKQQSLLLLRPITGRTHQLRVHLASIALPIMGDKFYCSEESRLLDLSFDSQRLWLHAETLGVVHPRTNLPLRFTAKRPFNLP